MADDGQQDEIAFNTPVGAIRAHGFNVMVILAIAILSWLTFTEHRERAAEHDELLKGETVVKDAVVGAINYQACLQRLNLFVVTAKDPTHVTLNNMPQELWNCLPKFMTEEQQEKRAPR